MSIQDEAIRRLLLQQEQAANQMSQNDGINIVQSEPDAPGFYEDAIFAQQEQYARQLQTQQQAANAMARQQSAYVQSGPGFLNMGSPIVPVVNPNAKVETEGQNTTVKPDGTVVIY